MIQWKQIRFNSDAATCGEVHGCWGANSFRICFNPNRLAFSCVSTIGWKEREKVVKLLLGIKPTTFALWGGSANHHVTIKTQNNRYYFHKFKCTALLDWTDHKIEIICLDDSCYTMGMVLFQRHQQMFISLIEYYDLVISNTKQGFQ